MFSKTLRTSVCVLGDIAVGKTMLISNFVNTNMFSTYEPTLYPEVVSKTINIPKSSYNVELSIFDCGGHQVSAGLIRRAIAECDCTIIVVSNTSDEPSTSEKVIQQLTMSAKTWLSFFSEATMATAKIKAIMVYNSRCNDDYACDLTQDQVNKIAAAAGISKGVIVNCMRNIDCDVPFHMIGHMTYRSKIQTNINEGTN